ncbi:MAG: antibiotic biosynthesis monooxygenase [Nitrospirota bacterium]|nr:antibiotic biosynthesis monooxygenase [Nitrospirota bacterium]
MSGTEGPEPGCWAVVFTSRLKEKAPGYAAAADKMEALARQQPGFLAVHSARGADRFGITVSWWESREAIAAWRAHPQHAAVRAQAGEWYEDWSVRILKLEEGHGAPH